MRAPILCTMQFLAIAIAFGTASAYYLEAQNSSTSEDKMAAVKRVVVMLEELQAQVLSEGEAEVATYNKFSCFCKDTMKDKGDAITEGGNSQSTTQARISSLEDDRANFDTKIDTLVGEIADLEKELDTLKTEREKQIKTYRVNEVDLAGALEALEGAIQSLKAAKTPSLAQWQQVAKTVRVATVMADALGLGGKSLQNAGAAFLIQEDPPDVSIEPYAFKSGDIITTLEGLQTDFKAKKNQIDDEEVTNRQTYDTVRQEKRNMIDTKNREIATNKAEKAKATEEIATASQDLTVISATLLDDKAYLKELSTMCTNKAKTWDARSKVRTDELSAITAAIGIIQDKVANATSAKTVRFVQRSASVWPSQAELTSNMELKEAGAEAAAENVEAKMHVVQTALLQEHTLMRRGLRGLPDGSGRKTIIDLLRSQGKHLQSAMLTTLASQIEEDPFAKVKTLLEALIERLLKQASNEATQKGWCDKSIAVATQKRDFAAEDIREVNGNMAQLEALRDKLGEEISELGAQIQALEQEQSDADADRAAEKEENSATVIEAKAGKEAVEEAIQLLDRFYKESGKATVDMALVQRGPASDDAPDPGFGAGEAYTGAQEASEGVLGLLEVIRSDFVRTKIETERAEAQAEQDHLDFTTRTQASIAQKTVAKDEKTGQKDDADVKFLDAEESLKTNTDLLKGALQELIQLHDTCVDTAMSYADRVANREEEIAALKKAECILTGYEQYGPDAAVSADC